MVLGSKHSLREALMLHLTMGDTEIEQATEVKLLGITVDGQMPWNNQGI